MPNFRTFILLAKAKILRKSKAHMQLWKFVLAGITGDLAKKKILPALAQFAINNQTEVQIELIGYSRSLPDQAEINLILNQASGGEHKLSKIEYIQGEYTDPNLVTNFTNQLNENQRLVIYLAVPPLTYLDIIGNSSSIQHKQADIIIEKPFGQNKQEAEQLLDLINNQGLENQVHFFDHYLFKNPAMLSKADKTNLSFLKDKWPSAITIKVIEEEGVLNRGGYYNSIGALKDMWPHIHNLSKLIFTSLPIKPSVKPCNYEWSKVLFAQYDNYTIDVNLENSNTETFFSLKGNVKYNRRAIPIDIVCGKKLGKKETIIEINFEDETKLIWTFYPHPSLQIISPEINFTLNLERNNNLDHTNLFLNLLDNDLSKFVTPANIHHIWDTYADILKLWKKQKQEVQYYNYSNWTELVEIN
jgi:glucose-6-phosphate 1-dehydrogenase